MVSGSVYAIQTDEKVLAVEALFSMVYSDTVDLFFSRRQGIGCARPTTVPLSY
jgi:hypothetical protein